MAPKPLYLQGFIPAVGIFFGFLPVSELLN
jgi:hypothetical protein